MNVCLQSKVTPVDVQLYYLRIYYIKLKSRLSVCLSVRTFLAVSISVVAAWIDVRLARNDSYVFWHDEVYF